MANNMIRAKEVFNTLCNALDARGWKYEKMEEQLAGLFAVSGDDIPMHFQVRVDAERELVRLTSPLMFNMPEDKRIDGALATCAASFPLADGTFDYDLSDGSIAFRMTATYRDSDIGETLFQYMLTCASFVVDEYNDKFMMLAKGKVDIEAFLQ